MLAAAAAAAFYVFSGIGTAAQAPAAAPATPNPDCSLVVPENPLSAAGLATPYQLTATNSKNGPCDEANTAQSAFVEATIVDPATGALSVYRPLVLNKGAQPAAPQVTPKLPANAVVGLWFGFNGTNLTLKSHHNSLHDGNCVNGLDNSIFGQFAFCDAQQFFTAANKAIQKGQIKVPALGMGRDGLPCMTTRDYGMIDQDQSDNVITSYLVLPNGRVAQNNTANEKQLRDSTTLVNGSDNLLLDGFINPALGCTPFQAPDLTNPGHKVSSLALNELFAAAHQAAPVALVPENDPMTLVNGKLSVAKTNLYRSGVNQPPLSWNQDTSYCSELLDVGPARMQQDKNFFLDAPSPDTGAANNLYTFLAQRWSASLTNLNCGDLIRLPKTPVKLTMDKAGVVVNATFPTPHGTAPRRGSRVDNDDSSAANQAPQKPRQY